MRSVPSGTLSMRATVPTTPTEKSCSGPGDSVSGSRLATITSIRSPPSTSLISRIDRSWPTASGVSVSGSVTESRSGSTGSASGSSGGAPMATSSPPVPGVAISITDRRPCRIARPGAGPRDDGSSTVRMPSS